MTAAGHNRDVAKKANRLYWGSDESVNQIAEDLDLSKSALYGVIGPLQSGYACPICGAEVEYPNRTARQREQVVCPECTWEGSEEETFPLDASGDGSRSPEDAAADAEAERWLLNRLLLGGALLGAAAGIALVRFTRRNR